MKRRVLTWLLGLGTAMLLPGITHEYQTRMTCGQPGGQGDLRVAVGNGWQIIRTDRFGMESGDCIVQLHRPRFRFL